MIVVVPADTGRRTGMSTRRRRARGSGTGSGPRRYYGALSPACGPRASPAACRRHSSSSCHSSSSRVEGASLGHADSREGGAALLGVLDFGRLDRGSVARKSAGGSRGARRWASRSPPPIGTGGRGRAAERRPPRPVSGHGDGLTEAVHPTRRRAKRALRVVDGHAEVGGHGLEAPSVGADDRGDAGQLVDGDALAAQALDDRPAPIGGGGGAEGAASARGGDQASSTATAGRSWRSVMVGQGRGATGPPRPAARRLVCHPTPPPRGGGFLSGSGSDRIGPDRSDSVAMGLRPRLRWVCHRFCDTFAIGLRPHRAMFPAFPARERASGAASLLAVVRGVGLRVVEAF